MRLFLALIASLPASLALAAEVTPGKPPPSVPQVYKGCAVPSMKPNHVWWFDAVNGDDAAGDGSQAAPWKTLGRMTWVNNGRSPPLLSTVPYYHAVSGGSWQWTPSGTSPIHPGDRIYLKSGDYGTIGLGFEGRQTENSDFVYLEAAPGQTPVIRQLSVENTDKWYVHGIKIQSLRGTDWRPLVYVKGSANGATSDIIIDGDTISSQDDISGWTQADWRGNARNGVQVVGATSARCVSVTNNTIGQVGAGALLAAPKLLFSGNVIDEFGEDGVDYSGPGDMEISDNLVTNSNYLNDGAHLDCMQGGVAAGTTSNVLIDSNRCIRVSNPAHVRFPYVLQGIDAFDGDWENLVVTNNAIVTSAYHGLSFSSVHGGLIANNTVLDDGLNVGNVNAAKVKQANLWLLVGARTHEGSMSNDVVVRNNLASGFIIDTTIPGLVSDHNMCVGVDPRLRCATAIGVAAPPGAAASRMFMAYNPATVTYDLRLAPTAWAIGAGTTKSAVLRDIIGNARGPSVDIGAYSYRKPDAPDPRPEARTDASQQ